MEEELLCFVAVQFTEDEKVSQNLYWYLSPLKDLAVGERVTAPLGRHNRCQSGVVRRILFAPESRSPYPMYGIKSVVGRTLTEDISPED